jgi:ATP-binding cassette subfamily B protein
MTLGGLLSFYAVLALLLRQVNVISWGSNTVLIGAHSLARVEAVFESRSERQYSRGTRSLEFRGEVALENASFGYGEVGVLRDIDLAIRPSERVALIGPNGAGKSTLVSLLLGLYLPQRGRLLADGVPFDELDVRALRRQIGVVLQDPVLFPGTIRDNIAYGAPDASDAAVATAAEAATASDFIGLLEDGYETVVGDEGIGLSGGLRQRIAIARALLGDPVLLVLDEPTTYLDESAVSALMARLTALPQAPAVLFVTHDPQVAVHAHRVVELRDGHIVREWSADPMTTATSWSAGG